MDIDTNIDNYTLSDMLNLFEVSDKLSIEDMNQINKTNNKLEIALSNDNMFDVDIYILFKKASVILKGLNKYRDYLLIKDNNYIPNINDDNKLIFYIKNTDKFEDTSDINYLLNNIINNKNIDLETRNYETRNYETNKFQNINFQNNDTSYPIVEDQLIHKINNTFENKIVSGDINSIKRQTKIVKVHIDSCFRDKYYNSSPSNFIYNLPKQFKNVVSMKLATIYIPISSYFTFTNKNNTFVVETNLDGDINQFEIFIPQGNYDNVTLSEYLNSTYFVDASGNGVLQNIEFDILSPLNVSTFEVTSGAPPNFSFSIFFTDENTDNMLHTVGWTLGFRLAKYVDITDLLVSEGLFDSGGNRYIYLSINDFQYNYNETNVICFDKTCIEEHTLAKIPIIDGKVCLIHDENNCQSIKTRQYNGPVNINKLDIKLLDKFGDIVDLTFMDFSFSLELEILYERNNVI